MNLVQMNEILTQPETESESVSRPVAGPQRHVPFLELLAASRDFAANARQSSRSTCGRSCATTTAAAMAAWS
jgi:hypothetical protein